MSDDASAPTEQLPHLYSRSRRNPSPLGFKAVRPLSLIRLEPKPCYRTSMPAFFFFPLCSLEPWVFSFQQGKVGFSHDNVHAELCAMVDVDNHVISSNFSIA